MSITAAEPVADALAQHEVAAGRRRLYVIPSSERELLTFIGLSVDGIICGVEKLARLGVDEACGLCVRIQLSPSQFFLPSFSVTLDCR